MLVNISMTFHEDLLNGFQVTELQSGRHCILFLVWPKFKGHNSKNIYPRVVVLAICTSSNVG